MWKLGGDRPSELRDLMWKFGRDKSPKHGDLTFTLETLISNSGHEPSAMYNVQDTYAQRDVSVRYTIRAHSAPVYRGNKK